MVITKANDTPTRNPPIIQRIILVWVSIFRHVTPAGHKTGSGLLVSLSFGRGSYVPLRPFSLRNRRSA